MFRFAGYVFFILLLMTACSDHSRDEFNIPLKKTNQANNNEHLAALSILSDAIKNNPSDPVNYYKRALLHYNIQNYKDGLVDITRAEKLDPNSGLYLYYKAKFESKLELPSALKNAQLAESQKFDSPDLYILLADLYLKEKQFSKSQHYMRKAENAYPYNSDLFLVKGKYYARQADTLTAINNFKRALSLTPHQIDAYDYLIKTYNAAKMPDSALVYNEMALKKFPDSRELVFNKAQILENVGALDSATKVYKRFLMLEPGRYDVLEKVGDIYFRKKNYAAAFLVYDKWGKAQPEQTKAFLKAAGCYEVQKKYAEAKSYLEKIKDKNPENINISSEVDRLTYILDAQENRYYDYNETYKSNTRSSKNKTQEEPEANRRIFDDNIGTIEKIQKRSQLNLGRDTTRH